MPARFSYRIRVRERIEVREGDECELVTWPELIVYYAHGDGIVTHFDTIDADDVIRELSSWDTLDALSNPES